MTHKMMSRFVYITALLLLLLVLPGGLQANETADDEGWGKDWPEKLAAWRHAKTPAQKQERGQSLLTAAMRAERPDLVEAVAAGGEQKLREGEIGIPRRTRKITLKVLREFPELGQMSPAHWPTESGDWLARRITRDHFEIWSPKEGWLFSRDGQLLNEARPPRRDGWGREWYGAFLPDGRWVTTDLWEFDRVLTFFSRDGKWLKEIPGSTLVPRTAEEMKANFLSGEDYLITWARSDKDGRGWVVQVGSNGGRGRVWIGPEGAAQPLGEDEGMGWGRCYARQLGPRGNYIWQSVPSDSGKVTLNFHVLPHGEECGTPHYFTGEDEDGPGSVRLPDDGNHYGFWPGLTSFFVVSEHALPPIKGGAEDEQSTFPTEDWTWFFDRDADFQGYIRAKRLADAADGRSMLFCTSDHRLVTLDRHRHVTRVERFVLSGKDEVSLEPLELFADLHLGLFRKGDHLVLASWKD